MLLEPFGFGNRIAVPVEADKRQSRHHVRFGAQVRSDVEAKVDRAHAPGGELTALRVTETQGNVGLSPGKAQEPDIADELEIYSRMTSMQPVQPVDQNPSARLRPAVNRTRPLSSALASRRRRTESAALSITLASSSTALPSAVSM